MFEDLTTWNPYFGCNYHCYNDGCWAKKRISHRIGTVIKCKKCYDFIPHAHLDRKIPSNPKIFVVAHGDLFGDWVQDNIIKKILYKTNEVEKEMWFFESKNPVRYNDYLDLFPENTVLSTTIESDRDYKLSYAPSPEKRYLAIKDIDFTKHISIEPIMDFDMDILVDWIKEIKPVKVAIGYDSLNNNLPEPKLDKTLKLIKILQGITEVEIKKVGD